MSSAQDRQANTSEARLDQLDHDMRQLMAATVQELAVSVRESRTRRMNSTGQVDEVRSNLSADEDGTWIPVWLASTTISRDRLEMS